MAKCFALFFAAGIVGAAVFATLRSLSAAFPVTSAMAATMAVPMAAATAGMSAAGGRGAFVGGADAFGEGQARHLLLEEAFYGAEGGAVALADEGDGSSVLAGACGAADAVDVVFGIVGRVVVDDHGDVVDVDAAADDVGGHEEVDVAGLELVHHVVALFLLQVGVHGVAVVAAAAELGSELLDVLLAAGEEDDALGRGGLEEVLEDGHLIDFVADEYALVNVFGGLADGYLYLNGVAHDAAGECGDLLGHRGREENGLALLGEALDDLEDVVGEAHIKHAVGLVEDEVGGAGEVEVAE